MAYLRTFTWGSMREKLENLRENGNISPFLYQKVAAGIGRLPGYMQKVMLDEAEAMSSIGVSSEDDLKAFAYIVMHAPKITRDISSIPLGAENVSKLSQIIFEHKKEYPIDTIYNFYKAAENALKQFNVPLKKTAYPQGQAGQLVHAPHNVKRWMHAMREIYALKNKGLSGDHALNAATKEWDKMEKRDFKHWMRFYEEGAHMKYKMAQVTDRYYASDSGVMIPLDHLRADMPAAPGMPNMEQFAPKKEDNKEEEAVLKQQLEQERRDEIKKKITYIEGRLRAAESAIRKSPDVARELQKVLDMDLREWLRRLNELRLGIVTAPLKNARSTLLEDLIIRQGNILTDQGFPKAGELMISLAQAKAPTVDEVKKEMGEPPAENKPEASEEEMPPGDMPPMEPMDMEPPDDGGDAVREFIDKLNDGGQTKKEKESAKDFEAEITVIAQELTEEDLTPEPDIEVSEEEERDHPLDPFEGKEITIEDVIGRLEAISNILKNREIPRQLNIVDLELDKLNMASFFPNLAEATRSALESNQYMATRIEEILGKLRGSVESAEKIDLHPEGAAPTTDALEEVRQGLADREKKEEDARERRDKKRLEPEEEKPVAPPELAEPAPVQSGKPTRIT